MTMDVVDDHPDPGFEPVPASTVVYPVSSQAQSFRERVVNLFLPGRDES